MISAVEIMRVSLKALLANKMRSFLTTLGIIIGVAAVIAAFAVGQGANKVIEEQIASLGSNFMMVFNERPTSGQTFTHYLTDLDAEAIKKECSAAEAVAPVVETSVQVIYGNINMTTTVTGSNLEWSTVREWVVDHGRDITANDVRAAAKVVVIGSSVAKKLFEGEDPIGKTIRVRSVPFQVVGVFKEKGQTTGSGWDQDDFMLTPLSTAQRRLTRSSNTGRVNSIIVKSTSMRGLSYLEQQIAELLRERHRIRPGGDDDFRIFNVSQVLEARRKSTQTMSLLLGAIAIISLVVGGIGIMNIMLVSVTERTREIGIRMAVGAKSGDIRLQFLIEAVTLSLLGGGIGVGVGIGASHLLAGMMQSPPVFGVNSILLAFFFSAIVGVGFGYYPAYRASLLNPIDALKYE